MFLGSALELAQCSHLASQVTRRNAPKVSDQFDLDTMDMTEEQTATLVRLLDEYSDVFSSGPDDLGRTGVVNHQIDTGNPPSIKQAPRRVPVHQQETVSQQVKELLQHVVVRRSTSP